MMITKQEINTGELERSTEFCSLEDNNVARASERVKSGVDTQ